MSQRVQQLTQELDEAIGEMIGVVERCSEADWSKSAKSDNRSAGVLAHHVAGSLVIVSDWVRSVAAGQPISVSVDAIDAGNREHAERYSSVSQDEAAAELRRNLEHAAHVLRGLTDDELARKAPIAFLGGHELTAAEVAERFLIGHARHHLNDIRAAISA